MDYLLSVNTFLKIIAALVLIIILWRINKHNKAFDEKLDALSKLFKRHNGKN